MKLRQRVSGGLIATIALGALFPGLTATATASTSSCWRYKAAEKSFVRKMNVARGGAGVGSLRLDKQLSRVARVHTRAMARKDRLYHTPSSNLTSRVTRWRILGENVGVGGDVASLHTAFMNSPAHRDNILFSRFRHVGVGTKMDGNTLWVTVVFESRRDPGTTLSMPRC